MPYLNILLFGGLLSGGMRNPAVWTAASVILWAAAVWRPPNFKAVPFIGLWSAWLGWAMISALASSEPLRSLAAFSRPATAILFFCMACACFRETDRRQWFWLLCGSSFILGLAALFWKTDGYPMVGLLFPYYNYTACVEATAFAACLGALGAGYPKKRRAKALLIGLMIFCLSLVLLAKSRGALAACAFSGIIWAWKKGWRRTLIWSVVVIAAIVVLLPLQWKAPWLKFDKPGAYVRPHLWASAIAIANDHPLLGIGPGLFERGFLLHNFPAPEGTLPARYMMRSGHAHSEFLQVAAETGWLGLVLFLWALGSVWFRVWRMRKRDWTQDAAFTAFHAALLQTFFDNILFLPALQWLFYSCLAVAGENSGEAPSKGVWRSRPRMVCAGGLILAAAAWIPNWAVEHYENAALNTSGQESIVAIHSALALASGDPGLWEDLARLNLKRSPPNIPGALDALTHASHLDPTNALHRIMQAEILGSQGKWPEARTLAEKALALEPHFVEARLLHAEALCQAGMRDAAGRELIFVETMDGKITDRTRPLGYSGMILYFDVSKYRKISQSVRKGC